MMTVIIGFIVLGFNSCTKYSFMSMEDKIVGTWSFEKVSFIKGFSMTQRDQTDSYLKWEYEFTSSGDFYMYDRQTTKRYDGKWYLTTNNVYNPSTDLNDIVYDLHVSVYNPDTRNIEQFIWEVTSLTGKRMRATEYFSNETWNYVMYRR